MVAKQQAGCLPVRGAAPGLEVLLVTSRYTGEWIAPKGAIEPGETAPQAALREAEEEAGVTGDIGRSLGRFVYQRGLQPAEVEVFVLQVKAQWASWPEQAQRRRRWFLLGEALVEVQRPEVHRMLLALRTG